MVEWWSYDPDEARSTCETLVMCFVRFYTVSVHCAANVKITRGRKETLRGHGGFHIPNGQLQLRLKLPNLTYKGYPPPLPQ